MADEIKLSASMVYQDVEGVQAAMQLTDVSVSPTDKGVFHFSQQYGTTETALVSGGIANIGLFMLQNLDPTNYVEVLASSGGTVIGKMLPGECYGPIRRGSGLTNPYLKANTATCKIEALLCYA